MPMCRRTGAFAQDLCSYPMNSTAAFNKWLKTIVFNSIPKSKLIKREELIFTLIFGKNSVISLFLFLVTLPENFESHFRIKYFSFHC